MTITIEQANKVLAEAIPEIDAESNAGIWWHGNDCYHFSWTIERAECREMVRDWFRKNHNKPTVTFFDDGVEYQWESKFKEYELIERDTELECQLALAEMLDGNEYAMTKDEHEAIEKALRDDTVVIK